MITLVVGLGNTGRTYEETRHNVGFAVVDRMAKELRAKSMPDMDFCRTARVRLCEPPATERRLTLAWPTTLMNRSGLAVCALLEELQLAPAEMLIVVDDFNLPLGALRFRAAGSVGGHNGLESILEEIGTSRFPRLRLGIGPPSGRETHSEFVLGRFNSEELPRAEKMLAIACEAVIFAVSHRLEEAMSKYNRSPALPDQP
jgi:PTH1 family peptidyl-tRNA hydrolase